MPWRGLVVVTAMFSVLALAGVGYVAWGRAPVGAGVSPNPMAELEAATAKDSRVLIRERFKIGRLGDKDRHADFTVVRVTSDRRPAMIALSVNFFEWRGLSWPSTSGTGMLTASGVEGLAGALDGMAQQIRAIRPTRGEARSASVEYRSPALHFGLIAPSIQRREELTDLYIEDSIGKSVIFDADEDLPKLRAIISKAMEKIRELEAR